MNNSNEEVRILFKKNSRDLSIVSGDSELYIKLSTYQDKVSYVLYWSSTGYGYDRMEECLEELFRRFPEAQIIGIKTISTKVFQRLNTPL